MALVAALILGANLALLGYAQPRSDPVGQLTPARLMQSESDLPTPPRTVSTTTVTRPTTITRPTTVTVPPTTVTTPIIVTTHTTVTRPITPPRQHTHTQTRRDD